MIRTSSALSKQRRASCSASSFSESAVPCCRIGLPSLLNAFPKLYQASALEGFDLTALLESSVSRVLAKPKRPQYSRGVRNDFQHAARCSSATSREADRIHKCQQCPAQHSRPCVTCAPLSTDLLCALYCVLSGGFAKTSKGAGCWWYLAFCFVSLLGGVVLASIQNCTCTGRPVFNNVFNNA